MGSRRKYYPSDGNRASWLFKQAKKHGSRGVTRNVFQQFIERECVNGFRRIIKNLWNTYHIYLKKFLKKVAIECGSLLVDKQDLISICNIHSDQLNKRALMEIFRFYQESYQVARLKKSEQRNF